MDRGYANFSLFNAIVKAKSSYIRDNSAYDVAETRELTEANRAAGVLSDQMVSLGKQANSHGCNLDGRWISPCRHGSPFRCPADGFLRGKMPRGGSEIGSSQQLRITFRDR